MTLVPLVERVQVDEQEAAPVVRERGVRLDGQRRREGLADAVGGAGGGALALLGPAPVDRARLGHEGQRAVAGVRLDLARLDEIEAGVAVEREHQAGARGLRRVHSVR